MAIRKSKWHEEVCEPIQFKNGQQAWIRNMRLDDVETVHELECLIFEEAWSVENFRHEVLHSKVSLPLVVEFHYELIGYAVPWFIQDEMHLANIATSPVYRQQGIAAALLIVMLEKSMRKGVRRIYLEVRPSNSEAINLYKKYGFETIGIRRRYYRNGEDAIVMQRFLHFQSDTIQSRCS